MVYITVRQEPVYHQMTIEEFLFDSYTGPKVINYNTTNTKTYELANVSEHFAQRIDTDLLIRKLEDFNRNTEYLRKQERSLLYDSFYIPKKSGGLRKIDAPKPELMSVLRNLKNILENDFGVLYHTSAFAYIKNRCTIDAVKRHQQNHSRWFGKLDLHNFFGSTNLDFVIKMFSMIFPFSEIVKIPKGMEELSKALDLAFLNGGLPQGTPVSPLITNVMMIPIDFKLTKIFRNYNGNRYIYTRYADDFIISSRTGFDVRDVENLIVDTMNSFGAPFTINSSKTRYGSSAGRNWNLGVMLNKDNQITVGHKKKRQLQSMLHNYIMDRRNGITWSKEDIRAMQGFYSYCHMVEKDHIDAVIQHINKKMEVDVLYLIKQDLNQ